MKPKVNERLFERAKRLNLNRQEADRWLKRNRAALVAYNEHVEKHGVFSQGLRSF